MTDISNHLKPNETCWVQYKDADGTLRYIVITKNIYRDKYYLIDVSGKKRKEIAQSVNPLKLEAKINLTPTIEKGKVCQEKDLKSE